MPPDTLGHVLPLSARHYLIERVGKKCHVASAIRVIPVLHWKYCAVFPSGLFHPCISLTAVGYQRALQRSPHDERNQGFTKVDVWTLETPHRAETWWLRVSSPVWLLTTEMVCCAPSWGSRLLLSLQRLLKFPFLSRTKVKAHLAVIIPVVHVSSNHMFYG